MIKINLYVKRGSKAEVGKSKGGLLDQLRDLTKGDGISQAALAKLGDNPIETLKNLPIRPLILPAIAFFLGGDILEEIKAKDLAEAEAVVSALRQDQTKVQAELAKYKGLDQIKAQLESVEREIRTKLTVIAELIRDRETPPKMMMAISNAIPKDAWLIDFTVKQNQLIFKGGAIGFNPVTDFMRSLEESVFFKDVTLKGTQQGKDAKGNQIATFEISASRRDQ
ncbi:MAG: PilN domain-containing protein [Bdellovibrionales bacterium]|nr:PilN domain-containing protein [Bdellovibrionales bacterium]